MLNQITVCDVEKFLNDLKIERCVTNKFVDIYGIRIIENNLMPKDMIAVFDHNGNLVKIIKLEANQS